MALDPLTQTHANDLGSPEPAQPAGEELRELLRSQVRKRALLDAIPDLMFRVGADGVYRDLKAEDPGELVADPAALLGRNVRELLPAHVAEPLMRAGEVAIATREVQEVEYRLPVLSGEERDFEGRVVASGADEFVVIVRDITDRKRQEEELRRLSDEVARRLEDLQRERDFNRAVVNATPSYLVLADAEGRIVRYNRSFERASGRPDDESVRGREVWEVFVLPEDVGRVRSAFSDLAGGGEPDRQELRLRSPEGEERVVEWTATPVRDGSGKPRFLFSGVDVTIHKQQEEELRRSRARIVEAADGERRRLERNLHDGAQQQLVFVSHALRLAARALPADTAKAKELVERAIEEVTAAHGELRELARGLHPALLTARGLVAAVRTVAVRSPLPVEVEAEDPEARYPERVETAAYFVACEALANVAKYADASRAVVRIIARGGGAELAVEVEDDGRGGADPANGSGLRGLADRVEALDGRLEVESRTGGGTIVRAFLPLH